MDGSPSVLMATYVSPVPPEDGAKLTGGIMYDHKVAEAFRTRGWAVTLFDLESLPRYAKMLKLPAPRRVVRACGTGHDVLVTDLGSSPLTFRLQHRHPTPRGRLDILICHHFRAHLERTPLRRLIYRFAERRIVAGADLLVANSPHTVSVLLAMGRAPADIVTAPPGLNVPRVAEPRCRDAASEILMVASIEPRKGVVDAVRALDSSGLDDVGLTIAGDPGAPSEYRRELDALIRDSGLETRVRFVGRLDSHALEAAYRRADAFLLLSRWEGYGMAIAEAMASGLPVISTTAGAIPGLVEHGVSGLLSEPGDWRTAAANLRMLFTDGDLRGRLARGALQRAAGFPTWEESTGRILDAVAERLRARLSVRRSPPGT
jgi:glycosyltransferase involved in cell wall biosynthesis